MDERALLDARHGLVEAEQRACAVARDRGSGVVLAALLLGYVGVYVITSNDLKWQLQTSLNRLLVQVWPLLLLTVFAALRAPESAAIVTAPAPSKASRKTKR